MSVASRLVAPFAPVRFFSHLIFEGESDMTGRFPGRWSRDHRPSALRTRGSRVQGNLASRKCTSAESPNRQEMPGGTQDQNGNFSYNLPATFASSATLSYGLEGHSFLAPTGPHDEKVSVRYRNVRATALNANAPPRSGESFVPRITDSQKRAQTITSRSPFNTTSPNSTNILSSTPNTSRYTRFQVRTPTSPVTVEPKRGNFADMKPIPGASKVTTRLETFASVARKPTNRDATKGELVSEPKLDKSMEISPAGSTNRSERTTTSARAQFYSNPSEKDITIGRESAYFGENTHSEYRATATNSSHGNVIGEFWLDTFSLRNWLQAHLADQIGRASLSAN